MKDVFSKLGISIGSVLGLEIFDNLNHINELIKTTGQSIIIVLTIVYFSQKIMYNHKHRKK